MTCPLLLLLPVISKADVWSKVSETRKPLIAAVNGTNHSLS